MTTQPPDRLFRPVSPAAQAKGERVFCAAVALLLVLSEVFSSNIQNTLPTFSHVCRIALTVTAAVLLVAKSLLLTQWQTKQQALTAAALAAFAVFTTAYGHDQWFLFAVLLGIGAKDVDLRRVLQVYLAAAAGGLLAVQLLHAAGIPADCTAMQAIGYKEAVAAVRGEASPQDAVAAIQLASRRYAKRQLTWLRRDPDLFWIRHEKTPDMDRACRLSTQFLSGRGIE